MLLNERWKLCCDGINLRISIEIKVTLLPHLRLVSSRPQPSVIISVGNHLDSRTSSLHSVAEAPGVLPSRLPIFPPFAGAASLRSSRDPSLILGGPSDTSRHLPNSSQFRIASGTLSEGGRWTLLSYQQVLADETSALLSSSSPLTTPFNLNILIALQPALRSFVAASLPLWLAIARIG